MDLFAKQQRILRQNVNGPSSIGLKSTYAGTPYNAIHVLNQHGNYQKIIKWLDIKQYKLQQNNIHLVAKCDHLLQNCNNPHCQMHLYSEQKMAEFQIQKKLICKLYLNKNSKKILTTNIRLYNFRYNIPRFL